MARPQKSGLDYFPLDVDIFESDKMLAISGEFSVKGEVIMLRLLCEIYRNGYFVEYSELLKNKMARLSGLNVSLIDEVVNRLVKYGFFDEGVFNESNVLTSKGIQKRYLEASKRRKNSLCIHYWLLERVNVDNNSRLSGVSETFSTQSKVKESKVNKIKESDKEKTTTTPDVDEKITFQKFIYKIDELLPVLLDSQQWKENVAMQNRISLAAVDNWIPKFILHLKASGQEQKTPSDAKKHFSSWIRIQLKMESDTVESRVLYDNPDIPPDNSGKWMWLNGAWRDTSKFTKYQKKQYGIAV